MADTNKYIDMSAKEALRLAKDRFLLLPDIQRKYVWKDEQILNFMDSLMRGYPIGTFLFWKVKKEIINKENHEIYNFIKNYHERDLWNKMWEICIMYIVYFNK